ncbi:MAG: GNAT family protein [Tistlia sp.]|uniref:GNAT family N-acetyltransferase n=1 Tax=Tistlia sp. TaxID=3057121 RepID=UPI0034A3DF99
MRLAPLVRALAGPRSGPPAPRLSGPRLELRAPSLDDWPAWSDLRRESRAFLTPWEPSWPADALTAAAFRRRIRQYDRERRAGSGHAFLVFRRDAAAPGRAELGRSELVGAASLTNLRRGVAQSASLGYWTGRRHARQGYMQEALGLLIGWSFGPLGLHRLEAACLPANRPSRSLLEKLGFREEGLARGYLMIDGRWQDHLLYGLCREDWRAPQG